MKKQKLNFNSWKDFDKYFIKNYDAELISSPDGERTRKNKRILGGMADYKRMDFYLLIDNKYKKLLDNKNIIFQTRKAVLSFSSSVYGTGKTELLYHSL